MKTPKDLENMEGLALAEKEQEEKRRFDDLEMRLSKAVDAAVQDKSLTPNGGTIIIYPFNREHEQFAIEYFHKHGWKAKYTPHEESWYSMTTRSDGYYTVHSFYLTPLKVNKKQATK